MTRTVLSPHRGPLYSEHNKRQYGILYDTFRPKRYWFVAVGLARRSMAVVVHTLLFNSGLARQFGLFVLILVFLLVHVRCPSVLPGCAPACPCDPGVQCMCPGSRCT